MNRRRAARAGRVVTDGGAAAAALATAGGMMSGTAGGMTSGTAGGMMTEGRTIGGGTTAGAVEATLPCRRPAHIEAAAAGTEKGVTYSRATPSSLLLACCPALALACLLCNVCPRPVPLSAPL